VHALIYKEFSDFFESFTEPILLTSANTFPSTHGYRRFFGPGPMLANLPEKINFRTDSCSGQESFSLLRLPSAVLLGGDRSILLSYGTISLKSFFTRLSGFSAFLAEGKSNSEIISGSARFVNLWYFPQCLMYGSGGAAALTPVVKLWLYFRLLLKSGRRLLLLNKQHEKGHKINEPKRPGRYQKAPES
jgi:hypothetical protein